MHRKSSIVHFVLPLIVALFQASGAVAGPQPRTHDGFFLRLSAGGGSANNKIEAGGDKIEISGTSGDIDFAIGGVVSPNLALHGTLFGWSVSDPTVDVTIAGSSGSGTAKGTATMSAVGGGLTYYVMPVNIYLTGNVGIGSFSFDPDSGSRASTKSGIALDLGAGKEWWVGKSWGLGVAAAYIFSSIPEKDVPEKWTGNQFSVRFTATLN